MDIDEIRETGDKFSEELEEELYKTHAGLKAESNVSAIYERYPDLSSSQTVNLVRTSVREAPEGEKRRLEFLREFVSGNFIEGELKGLTDRILTFQSRAEVQLDGEKVPYRTAPILLANEGNRERRAAIDRAYNSATAQMNPLLRESLDKAHQIAHDWGYEDYIALCEDLSGMDLRKLCDDMEEFLSRTEDMYTDVLSWHLKSRLGIRRDDAKKHDLAYLFRAPQYDPLFPQEDMLKRMEGFVSDMGIDPRAGGNITLDIEPRRGKSPRAFCSPIKIPERIVLVITPKGGQDDYRAFLHELGHALHFGHTLSELPFEYRRLGDNSVTEGYAMLFDHLLLNGLWLRGTMEMKDTLNFLQFIYFNELYMLRRYAAKLKYELILHSNEGVRDGSEYREILTDACKVEYPAEMYLADVDPGFYCARYLRAWLLCYRLGEHLTQNFDEDWFRNPKAGILLKDLWGRGQENRAEEIPEILGAGDLKIDPIIERMEAVYT
ncbi:MAG: hypothetical protein ACUVXI_10390 [bacterium]